MEAELWTEELQGLDNVTFKRFDPLDHLLRTGDGPSTPAQYMKKGQVDLSVIETITEWIKARG